MKPVQPLIEELDPAPPPWALARALARLPHLLFLDSAGGPAHLTRYSSRFAAQMTPLTFFRIWSVAFRISEAPQIRTTTQSME